MTNNLRMRYPRKERFPVPMDGVPQGVKPQDATMYIKTVHALPYTSFRGAFSLSHNTTTTTFISLFFQDVN
eukprot:scaffold906_cov186-Alexandrium_tamarense.AAC.23